MKSVVFKNAETLNKLFSDYYLYLMEHDIESKNSVDYIFYVLDYLNISSKYLKTFIFDNSITSNGIYIPEDKTIKMNISKIKGCLYLNYIDRNEYVLSYLNTLIHEITHVYQKLYKDNYKDDISNILRISEELKFLSNNDYNLYALFPDEIHSNFNSSIFLYNLEKENHISGKLDYLERSIIYYITTGMMLNGKIINSQLKYLYKLLLGIEYNEEFDSLDRIDRLYLGITKNKQDINDILKSYQTHKLCLNI